MVFGDKPNITLDRKSESQKRERLLILLSSGGKYYDSHAIDDEDLEDLSTYELIKLHKNIKGNK